MKKNILIIISIVAILLLSISISYAFFYYRNTLNDITLNSGEIAINFDDTDNTFSSMANYPKKDVFGKIDPNYYDFSISGKVIDDVIYYEIQIKEENNNTLDSRYIKIYLTDQEDHELVSPKILDNLEINDYNGNHIIYKSHILEDNQVDRYRLRMWIDESYTDNLAKTFQFKVNLYARNGEESINNVYTVTFDANGGNVDLQSKKVLYNSDYGYLPTPTKDGYTFLGWNGKNKFNKDKYLLQTNYINNGTSYRYALIELKPDNDYRVSVFRYNNYSGMGNGYLLISNKEAINGNTWTSIAHNRLPDYSFVNYIYSTNDSGVLYIGYASCTQNDLDTIWTNTNVQLEEGTEATAYEPYCVTRDIKVTQNKNHTLTAIWQENSN